MNAVKRINCPKLVFVIFASKEIYISKSRPTRWDIGFVKRSFAAPDIRQSHRSMQPLSPSGANGAPQSVIKITVTLLELT